ncbi:STAS domain-containing protein [Streptomyces sp. NBC_01013]|uniref:STAS domain-containing protein n=1 Tax=Streptomyces sp. NBC_01013 TaxID=2903718 RepID=UPI00386B386E|nr:STAS domain-containing protein [Streptomyces sp. NBC_01013]
MVRSGVARVILVGELDLDSGPAVQEAVSACLAKKATILCLDLTGVSFCDCAGLSALLRARTAVLRAGVDLVVEGVGTQLARLLRLIGAEGILTERNANPESTRCASGTAATHRHAETVATADARLRKLA